MREGHLTPTKLTASEGMVFTNGENYGNEVYLGIHDAPENWREVPEQEQETGHPKEATHA